MTAKKQIRPAPNSAAFVRFCTAAGLFCLMTLPSHAQMSGVNFNNAESSASAGGIWGALQKISNIILAASAVVGLLFMVFAAAGAAFDGQWSEAKSKIGAGFLMIAIPGIVKGVWLALGSFLN